MKNYVVTYKRGGVDLPLGRCVLHEPDCRHLRPNAYRPLTGKRKATRPELATQEKCKVCG